MDDTTNKPADSNMPTGTGSMGGGDMPGAATPDPVVTPTTEPTTPPVPETPTTDTPPAPSTGGMPAMPSEEKKPEDGGTTGGM